MTTLIAVLFFMWAATLADIVTTIIALRNPNDSEGDTLLYGTHPSAARLLIVGLCFALVFTIIGLYAERFGTLAGCLAPAVLGIVRAFGAVSNFRLLQRGVKYVRQ